jgi:hypothetical protein
MQQGESRRKWVRGGRVILYHARGHQIFKHPVEGKKGPLNTYVDQKMLIEIPPVPICRVVARAIIAEWSSLKGCCCAASCANHEPHNVELMTRGLAEFRDQRHANRGCWRHLSFRSRKGMSHLRKRLFGYPNTVICPAVRISQHADQRRMPPWIGRRLIHAVVTGVWVSMPGNKFKQNCYGNLSCIPAARSRYECFVLRRTTTPGHSVRMECRHQ